MCLNMLLYRRSVLRHFRQTFNCISRKNENGRGGAWAEPTKALQWGHRCVSWKHRPRFGRPPCWTNEPNPEPKRSFRVWATLRGDGLWQIHVQITPLKSNPHLLTILWVWIDAPINNLLQQTLTFFAIHVLHDTSLRRSTVVNLYDFDWITPF